MDRKMKLKAELESTNGWDYLVIIYGPSKGWEIFSNYYASKKSAKRSAERLAAKLGWELEWEE